MGLVLDLFRLTWYVELASAGAEARTVYRNYAVNRRRPGEVNGDSGWRQLTLLISPPALLSARSLGQVFFATMVRLVTIWAVPQAPEVRRDKWS